MSALPAPREPHVVLRELNQIEGVAPRDGSRDHRKFVRHSVRFDALITPVIEDALNADAIRVNIRNISLGGAGLVSATPVTAGSVWRLSLLMQRRSLGSQMFTVRHCRLIAPQLYMIGTQFCVDPSLICLMGLKLDEMIVGEESSPEQTDDFVSPDDLR